MSKQTILHIDTSDTQHIAVSLEEGGKRYEKTSVSTVHRAQALLPIISDLAAEHRLTLNEIREIRVVTGPGSFTGLRVGCAVANALGVILGIPVNGKRALVRPEYS